MEIAAGLYARALASAELLPGNDPRTRAVNAEIRAHIGRDLMLYGESIYLIDTTGGRVRLVRSSAADIQDTATGGLRYRLDIASATRHRSVWADGRAVLHFRINESPKDPTRGLSPFVVAGNTARLCGGVERLLGNEILGASGYIIPIPKPGADPDNDDPLATLREDLRAAEGRTLLAETTARGWGEGKASAPAGDYTARRYGANPPATLTDLRGAAETSLLAAAGIPPALVSMQDGTAQRESYRRFIHTTVEPLGHILAAEIERKLELPARFDFDRLTASLDLSGRARAFQSLVKGGMAAADAAVHAQLMETGNE